MKLSIITCTYNSENYLQECIDSVIAQNLNINEYEHIFVDAYSIDKTKEIIEKYAIKYPNVRLIERKAKGIYNAMNEGIREAMGEYILCLNSDDYLEKNILKKYLKFIQSTGYKDLYYGKQNNIVNGKLTYTLVNNYLFLRKILFKFFGSTVLIFQPTVLVKKDTLVELGLFDESKKIASDYGMWLNILKNKKEYIFFPYEVTNFRIHEGGFSSNKKNFELGRKEYLYFKRKYFPLFNVYISNMIDFLANIYGKMLSK